MLLGGVAATICVAGALLFAFDAGLRRWTHRAVDPAPARPAGGRARGGAVRQMVFGALWALGGLTVTLAVPPARRSAGDLPGLVRE